MSLKVWLLMVQRTSEDRLSHSRKKVQLYEPILWVMNKNGQLSKLY